MGTVNKNQESSAKSPLLALLELAKLKRKPPESPDVGQSGSEKCETGAFSGGPAEFGVAERAFLLALARQALSCLLGDGQPVKPAAPPEKLTRKRACFVTLTKGGSLRGCIGNLLPQVPLYQAVVDNARGAALRDPRFPPVSADEVNDLRIEISVLSEPQSLPFSSAEELLLKLRPHEDGVLLRIGTRMATFLPQVWDMLPDKVDFLDHLAQKAGCPGGSWRGEDVSISVYHVESFQEAAAIVVNN